MDRDRCRADLGYKYSLYFELLKRKIEQYKIWPWLIYNMDEKGFLIGILLKMKRIFLKWRYKEIKLKQMLQDGNREWITLIVCICADGTALAPALIYQAVSGKVQDTWLQDYDYNDQYCFFSLLPSGWMNDDLGYKWLIEVFNRQTKDTARRQYRLLILDGYRSHTNIKFINYCNKNKILLAIYPPHLTYTLQLLDIGIFKPLAIAYNTKVANFLKDC